MDGSNLRAGGVACVERLRNPIQAARLVLDKSPHIYFVGAGAEDFAQQHGMALIDNAELVLDPRTRPASPRPNPTPAPASPTSPSPDSFSQTTSPPETAVNLPIPAQATPTSTPRHRRGAVALDQLRQPRRRHLHRRHPQQGPPAASATLP